MNIDIFKTAIDSSSISTIVKNFDSIFSLPKSKNFRTLAEFRSFFIPLYVKYYYQEYTKPKHFKNELNKIFNVSRELYWHFIKFDPQLENGVKTLKLCKYSKKDTHFEGLCQSFRRANRIMKLLKKESVLKAVSDYKPGFYSTSYKLDRFLFRGNRWKTKRERDQEVVKYLEQKQARLKIRMGKEYSKEKFKVIQYQEDLLRILTNKETIKKANWQFHKVRASLNAINVARFCENQTECHNSSSKKSNNELLEKGKFNYNNKIINIKGADLQVVENTKFYDFTHWEDNCTAMYDKYTLLKEPIRVIVALNDELKKYYEVKDIFEFEKGNYTIKHKKPKVVSLEKQTITDSYEEEDDWTKDCKDDYKDTPNLYKILYESNT